MNKLSGKTSIVGIGQTEFSKNSGRSEMRLAIEAVMAALADAGLSPKDVDGMATVTMENIDEVELFRNIGGNDLKFWARTNFSGGGTLGPVLHAAMAIETGVADTVVCYRALNERSEYRFGAAISFTAPTAVNTLQAYHTFHGVQSAASMMGLSMQRYMYETGATSEDFANVAIAARKHASTNPDAYFYGRPLSFDEYMQSRMIADPLRLFDICQESDGAVAVVITSTERARSLRQKPAVIRSAAQASPRGMSYFTNYYRANIAPIDETRLLGEQLYGAAGISPADIDAAIIYDHFGPSILPALEAFGFCAPGEAKDFIKNGNIEIGGGLPVNTHGGQVGEAYVHGMNGISEAVRQVRGTAANQVKDAQNVLVTSGSYAPTTGAILGSL